MGGLNYGGGVTLADVSSAATGGAATVTSAVDITLTAASSRVQSISMSVSGLNVIAPNATTMQKGGPVYVLQNTGVYSYTFKNSSGVALTTVAPRQTVLVFLLDNSTSAGIWSVAKFATATDWGLGVNNFINSIVGSINFVVVPLSETNALLLFAVTVTCYVLPVYIGGGNLSFGKINSFAIDNGSGGSGIGIDPSSALISYPSAGVGYVMTATVDAYGAVAFSNQTPLGGSYAAYPSIFARSPSGMVLMVTQAIYTGIPYAIPITVSALLVPSIGVSLALEASNIGSGISVCALGANTFVTAHPAGRSYVLTVTGSGAGATVSPGALKTYLGGTCAKSKIVALSATTAAAILMNSSTILLVLLTISGTTIPTAVVTNLNSTNVDINASGIGLYAASGTDILFAFSENTSGIQNVGSAQVSSGALVVKGIRQLTPPAAAQINYNPAVEFLSPMHAITLGRVAGTGAGVALISDGVLI